jgi:hypothetical protein
MKFTSHESYQPRGLPANAVLVNPTSPQEFGPGSRGVLQEITRASREGFLLFTFQAQWFLLNEYNLLYSYNIDSTLIIRR